LADSHNLRIDAGMIRVASYNIRKAIGTDRRRNPARILDVLAEIDADIVALQEVDRRFGSRESALPVEMIRTQSAYQIVQFTTRPKSIGWHGNALLVKKSLLVRTAAIVEIPTLEPRGAVMADIDTPLGCVRIIGMHLDISGLRRRQQIRRIVADTADRGPALPRILMGDCNEWSHHGGSMAEFHNFNIAPTAPSFHSRRPLVWLDRIVASPEIAVLNSGTHHSAKARVASDHLPVWADVSLGG
jgi:endonuclease/exonuclease/phosphatase family metal-dependent hydrolase